MTCYPAVIIGCHLFGIYFNDKVLVLSRLQFFCFLKTNQIFKRFSKQALRWTIIDLYDFFSRHLTNILYSDLKSDLIVYIGKIICFNFKISIRKTKSKWIAYFLFCNCFKKAISNIDIFCVIISFFTSKICS